MRREKSILDIETEDEAKEDYDEGPEGVHLNGWGQLHVQNMMLLLLPAPICVSSSRSIPSRGTACVVPIAVSFFLGPPSSTKSFRISPCSPN